MRKLIWGITCLLCIGLSACQPIVSPTDTMSPLGVPATGEIPFETIALNETGEGVKNALFTDEIQLLLVTELEQVAALEQLVNPEDYVQLQQVDYGTTAVIALFRGWRGSSNYQTVVERIVLADGYLVVHAQFWAPSPYWASTDAVTHPYHLVKIHKTDLPSAKVELALVSVAITPTPPANVKD